MKPPTASFVALRHTTGSLSASRPAFPLEGLHSLFEKPRVGRHHNMWHQLATVDADMGVTVALEVERTDRNFANHADSTLEGRPDSNIKGAHDVALSEISSPTTFQTYRAISNKQEISSYKQILSHII
jgi:hypothetical protein